MTYQTRFKKTLITSNDLELFFNNIKEYMARENEKPNYRQNTIYEHTPDRKIREFSMVEEIAMNLQN